VPKVHFIKEDVTVEVPEGSNLRKEARKAGVNLYPFPSFVNCMGFSSCGRCYVLLKKGTMEHAARKGLKERLRLLLSPLHPGRTEEGRLACQVKVMGDLEVETQPPMNLYGEFK
jgi:ferredoxin